MIAFEFHLINTMRDRFSIRLSFRHRSLASSTAHTHAINDVSYNKSNFIPTHSQNPHKLTLFRAIS